MLFYMVNQKHKDKIQWQQKKSSKV